MPQTTCVVPNCGRKGKHKIPKTATFKRFYKTQSILVKHSNTHGSTKLFKDLQLSNDDVAYSLNKKGRWRVPLILKQQILYNHQDIKDADITLIESHKLKKSSRCVGYCSTKGELRNVMPKHSKTYFNSNSVTSTKETENDREIVTINVVYPCPKSSSLIYNRKYIETPSLGVNGHSCESSREIVKSKAMKSCSKRRHTGVRLTGCSTEILEQYEDFQCKSEYYNEDEFDDAHPRKNSIFTLGDMINTRRETRKFGKVYQTKDNPETDRFERVKKIIREQKPEVNVVKDIEAANKRKNYSLCFQPTSICIPSVLVKKEYLMAAFSNDYKECQNFPSKFIIDITRNVQQHFVKANLIGKPNPSAIIVFVQDFLCGLESNEDEIYDVFLNLKINSKDLRIETLLENAIYSVEEIVERVVSFITSIPEARFPNCKGQNNVTLPDVHLYKSFKFSLLHKSLGITASCYQAFDDTMNFSVVMERNTSGSHTDKDFGIFCFPPEICDICFCKMNVKNAVNVGACDHWFCDNCLLEYVESSIATSPTFPLCPGYECKSQLDIFSLVNIVSIDGLSSLFQLKEHGEIDTDAKSKWCPSPSCGRILTLSKEEALVNVLCDCGRDICFSCLQYAHWPLPCKQAVSYYKELKISGELGLSYDPTLIAGVWGHPCPKCKKFIERTGGCNFMTCVCSEYFCWYCGKSINDHSLKSACAGVGNRGKPFLKYHELKEDKPIGPNFKTKVFVEALENRRKRNSSSSRVLGKSIRSIAAACKHNFRQNLNFRCLFESFCHYDHLGTFRSFKVYLNDILYMYLEMKHIIEHTKVFCGKRDNICRLKGSTCIYDIVGLMETLSDDIVHILRNDSVRNMVIEINRCRYRSEKCVESLVRIMKKEQTKPKVK